MGRVAAKKREGVGRRMRTAKTTGSAKPSVAVLMPMVWAARNVVYSGVLERLTIAGVDVHLLMRDYDPLLLEAPAYNDFSLAASHETLIRPVTRYRIRGRSFLRRVIHSAFARRNSIGSYAIFRRWHRRDYSTAQRHKAQVVELLGTLVQPTLIFFGLCNLYNLFYRLEYDLGPARAQLRQLSPDLVWSTVNIEADFERAYILAARDLKIPVVNAILSFDNLTSKPAHLTYDHYLVWNRRMKDQLLRFYPQVSHDQVTITGTPQFDFHRRPEFLWSRHDTLECLGLPPGARYFLYTTTAKRLAPAEPDLVLGIAQRMHMHETLKDCWLVVRPHPLEDWGRWEGVLDCSDHIALSYPWDSVPDEERWTLTTPSDQAKLVSSLAHAVACLNVASTTAIDAAILDRPVIGVRFDEEEQAPRDIIYEGYDADHYRPLVESSGLRVARDWSELMNLMLQAINQPGRDQEARARMVAQECGVVDGRAAERVVDALLECLSRLRTER
jgi:hypothetical protein